MNSAKEVGLVQVNPRQQQGQIFLENVGTIQEGIVPGEYDRYNMKRLVSLTANIEGEDLGRVAGHLSRALVAVNESFWSAAQDEKGHQGWKNSITGEFVEGAKKPSTPPRGMFVDVRGQVVPMQQMFGKLAGGGWFEGLTAGLILAIVVILLLLWAYYQSLLLAIAVMLTTPAVLVGVILALLATGTTLNLQSFMGAIMAVGVATANSILLVTFAERARREGASAGEAAIDGAQHRLRPILMTSCAMIAGMVPLALAIGEGGEQTAPLGRAVIGGLIASTFTTLLLLPAVFAVLKGAAGTRSVSLDPDDPESAYFDRGSGPRHNET
jgi:multidrug efflux pump subunit AcrB